MGGALLVEGAAGEGKSRLVDELLARVAGQGGRALRVRWSPDELQPLLGAISLAVQQHIERVGLLSPARRPDAEQRLRKAAVHMIRGSPGSGFLTVMPAAAAKAVTALSSRSRSGALVGCSSPASASAGTRL